MHLDDLPTAYASRVRAAQSPAEWIAFCADHRAAAWIAWNVREDAWYGAAELAAVQSALDTAPAGLAGPALLLHVISSLQRLRPLTAAEQAHLPTQGINHVAAGWFSRTRRYDLAPGSAWAEGSVPGELADTLTAGDHFQVIPRARFAWLTFGATGNSIPTSSDETLRRLGLPWKPAGGLVLRVEVPIGALRAAGALFALPTLFDGLRPGAQEPDWRARPESEHRPGEPWGYARDMQDDGPGLPEVIAEITPAGTMNAECMAVPSFDWSTRPFLRRSAPR
ncbi:hypothetical protein [Sorangium sp. So ce131]|uniref:hypothetical protein n=1 Tax=Sorangium sp. So ce131 TaxID=3133282 RepID=UPI003F62CE3B